MKPYYGVCLHNSDGSIKGSRQFNTATQQRAWYKAKRLRRRKPYVGFTVKPREAKAHGKMPTGPGSYHFHCLCKRYGLAAVLWPQDLVVFNGSVVTQQMIGDHAKMIRLRAGRHL